MIFERNQGVFSTRLPYLAGFNSR